MDLDSGLNADMKNEINPNDEFIIFEDDSFQFVNWIMIMSPKHPIMERLIQESVRRIQQNVDNIFLATGPTLFTDVLFSLTISRSIFTTRNTIWQNK